MICQKLLTIWVKSILRKCSSPRTWLRNVPKLHVSPEGCAVPLHGDEDERDTNTKQYVIVSSNDH